jgi:hypothetical protein
VLEALTSRYLNKCFYFERRLWQHLRLQRGNYETRSPAEPLRFFLFFFLHSNLFVISRKAFGGPAALYYPTLIAVIYGLQRM